jgi:hypothetical protein
MERGTTPPSITNAIAMTTKFGPQFLKNTEKDISTFLMYGVLLDAVLDSILQ